MGYIVVLFVIIVTIERRNILLYYVANEVNFKGQFAFSRNGGPDKLKMLDRIRD